MSESSGSATSRGRPLYGPMTPGLVGMGLRARRLLPGEPVHRLPEEVGMAVVPRVLLDQVEQDPSQAGCPTVGPGAPGESLQAALCPLFRALGRPDPVDLPGPTRSSGAPSCATGSTLSWALTSACYGHGGPPACMAAHKSRRCSR